MKRAKTSPDRAVAYLRVSTDEQHLGPAAQRAAIEAWASRSGVEVVAWHADHGISGSLGVEQRPALAAALADLSAQKAGTLVVAKRDRLARDIWIAQVVARDAARRGARIVAADGVGNGDSPADELMRTILDGVAAFERSMIRARVRAAMDVARRRGRYLGEAPFGTRATADGTLEPEPREVATITRILLLRLDGLSISEIAARLAAEGHVGRTGRPLGRTQIQRVLAAQAPTGEGTEESDATLGAPEDSADPSGEVDAPAPAGASCPHDRPDFDTSETVP